mmetsp:Transcript_13633/g.36505  ORF Transcript_13633/g.36505 Transcript_13633/m.36505 type:complete len:222 (+) Transcript_13633:1095-1760(+)
MCARCAYGRSARGAALSPRSSRSAGPTRAGAEDRLRLSVADEGLRREDPPPPPPEPRRSAAGWPWREKTRFSMRPSMPPPPWRRIATSALLLPGPVPPRLALRGRCCACALAPPRDGHGPSPHRGGSTAKRGALWRGDGAQAALGLLTPPSPSSAFARRGAAPRAPATPATPGPCASPPLAPPSPCCWTFCTSWEASSAPPAGSCAPPASAPGPPAAALRL